MYLIALLWLYADNALLPLYYLCQDRLFLLSMSCLPYSCVTD